MRNINSAEWVQAFDWSCTCSVCLKMAWNFYSFKTLGTSAMFISSLLSTWVVLLRWQVCDQSDNTVWKGFSFVWSIIIWEVMNGYTNLWCFFFVIIILLFVIFAIFIWYNCLFVGYHLSLIVIILHVKKSMKSIWLSNSRNK